MNTAAQYETDKILDELPDRISDVIKPFVPAAATGEILKHQLAAAARDRAIARV
jgi:hypothetical protein